MATRSGPPAVAVVVLALAVVDVVVAAPLPAIHGVGSRAPRSRHRGPWWVRGIGG